MLRGKAPLVKFEGNLFSRGGALGRGRERERKGGGDGGDDGVNMQKRRPGL